MTISFCLDSNSDTHWFTEPVRENMVKWADRMIRLQTIILLQHTASFRYRIEAETYDPPRTDDFVWAKDIDESMRYPEAIHATYSLCAPVRWNGLTHQPA